MAVHNLRGRQSKRAAGCALGCACASQRLLNKHARLPSFRISSNSGPKPIFRAILPPFGPPPSVFFGDDFFALAPSLPLRPSLPPCAVERLAKVDGEPSPNPEDNHGARTRRGRPQRAPRKAAQGPTGSGVRPVRRGHPIPGDEPGGGKGGVGGEGVTRSRHIRPRRLAGRLAQDVEPTRGHSIKSKPAGPWAGPSLAPSRSASGPFSPAGRPMKTKRGPACGNPSGQPRHRCSATASQDYPCLCRGPHATYITEGLGGGKGGASRTCKAWKQGPGTPGLRKGHGLPVVEGGASAFDGHSQGRHPLTGAKQGARVRGAVAGPHKQAGPAAP